MSRIGTIFQDYFRQVVKHEIGEIKSAFKKAGNDIAKGGNTIQEALDVAHSLKDSFVDMGGAAIGYAELLGFRFAVAPYRYQVSSTLTRGSRLDGNMTELKEKGFQGVVNLCAENDDDTVPAKQAGINSLHLPVIDNTPPSRKQMIQFLDFVTNPANQPAYVHCAAGRGRTGVAVACYRMAVEGESVDKAIAEAKAFGLAMPEQEEFLRQFANDLAAGTIDGYPK